MKQWYVVHTHPRGERLAAVNLRRQGLDAYLPQYLKRRRHARRTRAAIQDMATYFSQSRRAIARN